MIAAPPIDSMEAAIAWAKSRNVVLPEEFYQDLQQSAKDKSFTVSGLAGLAQIQETFNSLNEALAAGETFADWQSRTDALLGSLPDGRTETIFRNFVQQAYNAGRWTQFERNKRNRPYLLFSAVNDARTTEICRHRNGIIRAVDDSFWKRNSPQLHHRCRSHLISLTAAQAEARSPGGTGLHQPNPTDRADDGWGYRPMGDDLAAGLAQAVADAVQSAPKSWFPSIVGFFSSIWNALTGWLSKLL